jgi:hypothetical protein
MGGRCTKPEDKNGQDSAGVEQATAASDEPVKNSATLPKSTVGEPPLLKLGDQIPDVFLDKGFPPEKVALADFCKDKKVVLMGLPGAFTPT